MTPEDTKNSVSQIFELLKREKTALINGDLDALEDVTEQKQAWITDWSDTPLPLDIDQIRKIKRMSDQNASLSQTAQMAQKSVLQRLSDIQKIQKTMGIYAVDGTFSEASDPPPSIETRS